MSKWMRLIRYDWPLHFVLVLTEWMPDNIPILALRGWLAHFFFRGCGRKLQIGRSVSFYNPSLVSFGKDTYIAHGCRFIAGEKITIGDEVQFGPYCVVVSSTYTRSNGSFRHGSAKHMSIDVGSGSWIGSHVTITAGTNIGAGCLVAAGSVTRGEIPSNVMVGGAPARLIKEIVEDER